jgi:hypothetical protein
MDMSCRISMTPSRNRGFLFVEYYNDACADYARQKLSSPNFEVDGSQWTVIWAEPKGSTESSSAAYQVGAVQGRLRFYGAIDLISQFLKNKFTRPKGALIS